MWALEVWINGEKKCVAGTNDHVLNAIIDAMRVPRIGVGGIIEKDGESFHVDWLTTPLQAGDEVRIRLIETDTVDPPTTQKRRKSQQEKDDEIRKRLLAVRAYLPTTADSPQRTALEALDQHMNADSFVFAMKSLAEVGEASSVPAEFWKELKEIAFSLQRYDESRTYREIWQRLNTSDTETQ